MKRTTILTTTVALLLLVLSVALHQAQGIVLAQTGGPYDLTWSTIDGGGATFSTGGDYSLGGTIGQPDAGEELSGGSYSVQGGFWNSSSVAGPTAVTLSSFTAKSSAGLGASLAWLWLVGVATLVIGSILWVRWRLNRLGRARGNSN